MGDCRTRISQQPYPFARFLVWDGVWESLENTDDIGWPFSRLGDFRDKHTNAEGRKCAQLANCRIVCLYVTDRQIISR